MEAFQGVFAKRGSTETKACLAAEAFEDVFVRRGRWRKAPAESSEQIAVEVPKTDERLTKQAETVPCEVAHEINVQNTFISAKVIDFDSLRDFLHERKVKSCPASRQGSAVTETVIDELLANSQAGLEEILNTASSYGDIPVLFATQKEAEHLFDDASSMPSGSTGSGDEDSTLDSEDSHSTPNEEVFNTASTFQDLDFDVPQETALPRDTAGCVESQSPTSDRLQSLRLQGASIRQKMAHTVQNEQPTPVMSARGQQTPSQFIVAIQTPDGIKPGLVTLLGDAPTEPSSQYPAAPPSQPPRVAGGFSAPAVPPPTSAPVLSLADTIATPEVGTEELPSIGSLMHHTGECKPCTFFHTRGCENGDDCKFCHLCGPKEKKKRIKAQKAAQREANFIALEHAKVALARMRVAQEQGVQVESIVE